MSWDFDILKTNLDDFEIASFEEFCKTKGYAISIHPNTNLKEDSGFLPLKIAGDFLPSLNGKDFISGFEFYSSVSKAIAEPLPIVAQPKGFLKSLFAKKQPSAVSPAPAPAYVAATQETEKYDLALMCKSNLLEIFTAHLFGLYFTESQGCECYDPQDDIEYRTAQQIEKTLNDIVAEMKERLSNGDLELHIFESWS